MKEKILVIIIAFILLTLGIIGTILGSVFNMLLLTISSVIIISVSLMFFIGIFAEIMASLT